MERPVARYVYVVETYDGHGYTHLVHHLKFEFSNDGWWGAKLLCSGVIADGGKLPVKDDKFLLDVPVTCLACLVKAWPLS